MIETSAETARAIAAELERYRFREGAEEQLQAGVTAALMALGLPFAREVPLAPKDRIDFLVGRVGIECKIGGSLAEVTRQLYRYSVSDRVDVLLLVTTRVQLARVPETICGKPVLVVATMGGLL